MGEDTRKIMLCLVMTKIYINGGVVKLVVSLGKGTCKTEFLTLQFYKENKKSLRLPTKSFIICFKVFKEIQEFAELCNRT